MENKNILIIPLWLLYNVESIDKVKHDDILANNIAEYELKDRKHLYSIINSTEKNFDFHSLLENLPNQGKLKFSNDKIFEYLMNFKKFMENEKYNLLIK